MSDSSSPSEINIVAPLSGIIETVEVRAGQKVKRGDLIALLESMKVHVRVESDLAGYVEHIRVQPGDNIERGALIAIIKTDHVDVSSAVNTQKADHKTGQETGQKNIAIPHKSIQAWRDRQALTLDEHRVDAVERRHAKGYSSARENLARLCDFSKFQEYGQLAVAAQRQRQDYETLKTTTAADGVITGIGKVSGCLTALLINDYSVLAGTQGFFHHQKIDRLLGIAKTQKLPVIMFTEGGGGRPGDTDVSTVVSGLQCTTFSTWAGLKGVVPRIAIANGYNFAGNAALFGAADITIATKSSWIGMAGPAMIAGGGLGDFKATEIGPIDVQSRNGVVDIVVENETQACDTAKQLLLLLNGQRSDEYTSTSQEVLRSIMPTSRRQTYEIREILETIADRGTLIELRSEYGGSIVTALMQIEGTTVGILANDCSVMGGAVDVHAGRKADQFMQFCDDFSLPIVSFCDTPGFMVGPNHEETGAVRSLAKLFSTGAQIKVPFYAVVLRKCYGLGAQAMLAGSTQRPIYTISWPTGEFGAMGLEGAVKLGFKKELDAQDNEVERQKLFDALLAKQYEDGQATEVASLLELDAVIDPIDTRATLAQLLY